MVDTYEGFVPTKSPELVIHGVGYMFFFTSCVLAFLLFPSLFESSTFVSANSAEYVSPEQDQFLDLGIVVGNHLGWMLGSFVVSGFMFRKRRLGVYLGGVLLLVAYMRFQFIPLTTAGQVLLVTAWTLGVATVACYWNNLD